jgi:Domain of unknown function (DUF5666)
MNFKTNYLLVLVASLLITACDGGIGGTGNNPNNNGGASVGTVTAFGSVWVNGVEFDTTNAAIWEEGEPVGIGDAAALANLEIGQVVEVRGDFSSDGVTGTATLVRYSDMLEGPIAEINPATSEIWVMGYWVIIDAQTILVDESGAPQDFGALAKGDVVEISGLPDELGRIRATYLELDGAFEDDVTEVEVKGSVSNLDLNATTFKIGLMTINFSGASLPSEPLGNGQWVEVDGTTFTQAGYGLAGAFTATSVEQMDNTLTVADGERVEIEGFITSTTDLAAQNEFTLSSQVVQVTNQTIYTGGSKANLAVGAKIEAEGSWSGGILIAEEIEFE